MSGGGPRPAERIGFKAGGGIRLFDPAEIVWVEAAGKASRVHSASDSEIVQIRLGAVIRRLSEGPFVRISRFAVVNLKHVVETVHKTNGDHTMRLSNGRELILSRLHRAEVLRRLMKAC